jgi:hypothetical protein
MLRAMVGRGVVTQAKAERAGSCPGVAFHIRHRSIAEQLSKTLSHHAR